MDAASTHAVEVVLLMITHPLLTSPIRLSTDPTTRLSYDPLSYGTRSTWRGSNPVSEPFHFIVASADLPGDQEEVPTAARIVLENLHQDIGALLRSFTDWATIDIAVVMADTPNLVELQYLGLKIIAADGDLSQIVISAGRPALEDETVPMDRMTKDRFPGLFQ